MHLGILYRTKSAHPDRDMCFGMYGWVYLTTSLYKMALWKKDWKKEGIILSSKIFQAVKENPNLSNELIASQVACTVENVEDVRKMFSI